MRITNLSPSDRDTIREFLRHKRAAKRAEEALEGGLTKRAAKIIRANGGEIDCGRYRGLRYLLTLRRYERWNLPEALVNAEIRLKQRIAKAKEKGLCKLVSDTLSPYLTTSE